MKFSRRAPEAPEINLIPFIDILLVVLIFLVLTTSYQRVTHLDITLPTAQRPSDAKAPERIQVGLDAKGKLSLNGRVFDGVTLVQLRDQLTQLAKGQDDAVVVIHADAQVAHQRVVDVMTAARMAGLVKIVFAARTPS